MARRPAIEVEGLRELQLAFRAMGGEAPKALRRANKRGADVVAREAVRRVPMRTGRLRDSIRALAQQRSASVKAGSARVPYAGPIHFGWPAHHIAPQPFLYDAADARRGEVVDEYADAIRELRNRFFD